MTWEQRVMEGNPKFEATQDIPDVPYHRFAELIGLQGHFRRRSRTRRRGVGRGARADRPVVLECKTDPEVPPLPPHITLKQAKAFTSTLIKGDPNEAGVIVGTVRQSLASILPEKD